MMTIETDQSRALALADASAQAQSRAIARYTDRTILTALDARERLLTTIRVEGGYLLPDGGVVLPGYGSPMEAILAWEDEARRRWLGRGA